MTVGPHPGFDRVVLTSTHPITSWEVRYVPQVTNDPTGAPVPLLGAADILVVVHGTDCVGHPSVQPDLTPAFPALRQVRGAREFDGVSSDGIGQQCKPASGSSPGPGPTASSSILPPDPTALTQPP